MLHVILLDLNNLFMCVFLLIYSIPEHLLASITTARRRPAAAPDKTATRSTTPAPTPTNRPCSPSTSSRPSDVDAYFAKEQI